MLKKVIVGGTFDGLHAGHQRILTVAAEVGESVIVGLTSDEFAGRFRTRSPLPYAKRKAALEKFLGRFKKPHEVVKIQDSYGFATLMEDLEAIVVSEETLLRAEEINHIRFKKGLPKLVIVVIPLVVTGNGEPISTERIKKAAGRGKKSR
ncbi:Phosphopantetheine adenylyltransferase [uncultured archaeon]|nr:Phosphopantetheine adenylyltransferase [uncultured archaeon]